MLFNRTRISPRFIKSASLLTDTQQDQQQSRFKLLLTRILYERIRFYLPLKFD